MTQDPQLRETAPESGALVDEKTCEAPTPVAAEVAPQTPDDGEPDGPRPTWRSVLSQGLSLFRGRFYFFAFVWGAAALVFVALRNFSFEAPSKLLFDNLKYIENTSRSVTNALVFWAYWLLASPLWLLLRKLAI
ncbi:MAG: hypothetical protein HUK22_08915, partial [Thermoguttaceae bacterium]|nr:hypothetical protein [Thermoguttaceae bacterium]